MPGFERYISDKHRAIRTILVTGLISTYLFFSSIVFLILLFISAAYHVVYFLKAIESSTHASHIFRRLSGDATYRHRKPLNSSLVRRLVSPRIYLFALNISLLLVTHRCSRFVLKYPLQIRKSIFVVCCSILLFFFFHLNAWKIWINIDKMSGGGIFFNFRYVLCVYLMFSKNLFFLCK